MNTDVCIHFVSFDIFEVRFNNNVNNDYSGMMCTLVSDWRNKDVVIKRIKIFIFWFKILIRTHGKNGTNLRGNTTFTLARSNLTIRKILKCSFSTDSPCTTRRFSNTKFFVQMSSRQLRVPWIRSFAGGRQPRGSFQRLQNPRIEFLGVRGDCTNLQRGLSAGVLFRWHRKERTVFR